MIIGGFGPANGFMTQSDCVEMMTRARAAEVPHLAWTFHQRCPPNLIQETARGTVFKNALAAPW